MNSYALHRIKSSIPPHIEHNHHQNIYGIHQNGVNLIFYRKMVDKFLGDGLSETISKGIEPIF